MTPERIDIAEFRALGFLQEVNRLFFHPLGLALEIVVDDCRTCNGGGTELIKRGGAPELIKCRSCKGAGKTERLGGVWDYRDDPEGMAYGLPMKIDTDKVKSVEKEFKKHAEARVKLFNATVQKPGQELEIDEEAAAGGNPEGGPGDRHTHPR